MARFIPETQDSSRRTIRPIDHPFKYKHKTNYPDELCEYPESLWFLSAILH